MNLTVLLADYAQTDTGSNKIHAVGMGWTHTRAPSPVMSVIAIVEVDPADLPDNIDIRLELRDSDDALFVVESPEGPRPVVLEAQAHAVSVDEAHKGEPVLVPLVIQLGQGVLTEPGVYVFHVTATRQKDGHSIQNARDFLVLPPVTA